MSFVLEELDTLFQQWIVAERPNPKKYDLLCAALKKDVEYLLQERPNGLSQLIPNTFCLRDRFLDLVSTVSRFMSKVILPTVKNSTLQVDAPLAGGGWILKRRIWWKIIAQLMSLVLS